MSIATLNSALYRKVKTHTKYDRYFTKTPCRSTFLGDYTTTGGMQQMVELSFKYKDFTKAISKKLKGRNLKETVANIYQFAYDHIQYQADGYDQQLRSPSCTWNVRLEGVDCKSYSLFVSTILTNLNIPHSFRKVKQPSSPSRWSHVYVQIPSGNETLIIDPTKRVNTEVNYTQKEDMEVTLPYHALHGSVESLMNLEEDLIQKSIGEFNRYLKRLSEEGVPSQTVREIKNAVRFAIETGNDPSLKITKEAFIINGQEFYLTSRSSGLGIVLSEAIGVFSDLFGPEDRGSVLARADRYIREGYTKATNILNTQGMQPAISYLDAQISKNRALYRKYTSGNSKAKHKRMADAYEEFKKKLLVRNQTFLNQGTSTSNSNSSSNTGSNTSTTVIDGFVKLTNGLFKNLETGQVVVNPNQSGSNTVIPNTDKGKNSNKMSTESKIAIGVAGAVAIGSIIYVSQKNNTQNNK
ncbi:transglutaminase-like domain-containing protein [Tenacibaculum ovolyticum]|uniref:transglutaminase-like domain-containing protein n=1 Tax=Tenacibaculum ovolyticum TaxID=104270 RepID=UPI000412400E|nr:transglutaminase-like domain-containing protein [Tenacibaculum ovolyticum]